jgi:flavin reductase (DIM6/NTAB) family NADH-FMN oxidoreductase RutF
MPTDHDQPGDAFDQIVSNLDYPMFVIGAAAHGDADACLVGFTSQCSIDPPRFAVFLSKANHTYELARQSDVVVVHRLRAEQHDIAEHFGGTSKHDDPTKLTGCAWTPGPGGVPVIADCDWFAGRVLEHIDVGDHVAFVLEPFGGSCSKTDQLDAQDAFDIEAGRPAD